MAKENGIKSIAFPAISTGIYGYPKKEAAETALHAIREWLNDNNGYGIKVILVCYDDETYLIYLQLIAGFC